MIQEAQLAHMVSHQWSENQGQDNRESTEREYEKQDILLRNWYLAKGANVGGFLP
jgi:hypothetical protein